MISASHHLFVTNLYKQVPKKQILLLQVFLSSSAHTPKEEIVKCLDKFVRPVHETKFTNNEC